MTGNELAKTILNHKGEVCIAALMGQDAPYIRAVKADLIAYLRLIGDGEAGCEFRSSDGIGYIDQAH